MKRVSIFFLLAPALLVIAGQTETPSIDDLDWLAGHWKGTLNGAEIEEVWLPPAGDQMIGINRTLIDGESVNFEFLRIKSAGGTLTYMASPGGRCPATPFQLESISKDQVVFSNPAHDFPQRILYRRDGDTLHARIEGDQDGSLRSIEWSWTLASTPSS